MAHAALVYGTEILPIRRDDVMVEILRDALDALPKGDSPLRARVLTRLGAALIPTPLPGEPEPLALASDGLAMARRTGDKEALLHALRWWSATVPFDATSEQRHRIALEQAELAVALGKKVAAIAPLTQSITGWLDAGDVAGATSAIDMLAARLAELPQPHYQWRLPMVRATRAAMSGRFAEAHQLGLDALAQLERAGLGKSPYYAVHLLGLEHARRDGLYLEELEARFGQQVTIGAMPAGAWIAAASGRTVEAIKRMTSVIDRIGMRNVPPVNVPFAEVCLFTAYRDPAPKLYELIAQEAPRNPLIWGPACVSCMGPMARAAGDLAAFLGRDEAATAHFTEALDLAERIGARAYVAQIQLSHGALLARTGETVRAGEMLRRALATATACEMKNIAAQASAQLDALGSAARPASSPPPSRSSAPPTIAIERDGELWSVTSERGVLRMRDAKGLHFLAHLVRHPHQEFHVSQLAAQGEAPEAGDAGAVLDPKAKAAYARRVEDLRDEVEEATAFSDRARADRARAELDAIARELARAVGLGGRDRKAASRTERARINVQRRIRDAIERIREQDPALGRYLEASMKTGTYCSYAPPWSGRDG